MSKIKAKFNLLDKVAYEFINRDKPYDIPNMKFVSGFQTSGSVEIPPNDCVFGIIESIEIIDKRTYDFDDKEEYSHRCVMIKIIGYEDPVDQRYIKKATKKLMSKYKIK